MIHYTVLCVVGHNNVRCVRKDLVELTDVDELADLVEFNTTKDRGLYHNMIESPWV
jgi:hypothetical protein